MQSLKNNKERNDLLNFIKGIGCLFVIFIHIKFPGVFGEIIWKIGQFAVPVFFMIAGYYSYKRDCTILIRRLKKIVKILVVSYLIYFIYALLLNIINNSTESFFKENYNIKEVIKTLLFSNINFAIHLWYLIAMAETYLFFILVEKLKYDKVYKLSPLFVILHFTVVILAETFEYPWFIKMNFMVWGVPLFLIGYSFANRKNRWNDSLIIVSILLGIAISILPLYLSFQFNFSEIGVILLSVGLFECAIKYPNVAFAKKIAFIGCFCRPQLSEKCST